MSGVVPFLLIEIAFVLELIIPPLLLTTEASVPSNKLIAFEPVEVIVPELLIVNPVVSSPAIVFAVATADDPE